MILRESPAFISVNTPVVSVVDSDASVRRALELVIRSAGWIARTFASAAEFLSCPRLPVPGCLISEVRLEDLDGLDLQRRIADRSEMPVIFLTQHFDVMTTVRAMKAGAFEFMTKPLRSEALATAMAAAIEHSRAALKREAGLRVLRERHAALSYREQQVMALVVQGLLNKLIGAELGISEITVKAHRGRMMQKMKAQSVPHLVAIAACLATAPGPYFRPIDQDPALWSHRPIPAPYRMGDLR